MPGTRGRRCFLAHQPLGQFLGVIFDTAPGFNQIFARYLFLQIGYIFFRQLGGQKIHDRSPGIRSIAKIHHLLAGLHQIGQPVSVDLCRVPVRMENLEPALFFQHLDHIQGIVFVGQRSDFVAHRRLQNVVDVIPFLSRVISRLGTLLYRPVEARSKTGGADQARGIFQK